MNSRILGLVEAVLIVVIVVLVPGYVVLKPGMAAQAAVSNGIDGARIVSQAPGEWLSNGRT